MKILTKTSENLTPNIKYSLGTVRQLILYGFVQFLNKIQTQTKQHDKKTTPLFKVKAQTKKTLDLHYMCIVHNQFYLTIKEFMRVFIRWSISDS